MFTWLKFFVKLIWTLKFQAFTWTSAKKQFFSESLPVLSKNWIVYSQTRTVNAWMTSRIKNVDLIGKQCYNCRLSIFQYLPAQLYTQKWIDEKRNHDMKNQNTTDFKSNTRNTIFVRHFERFHWNYHLFAHGIVFRYQNKLLLKNDYLAHSQIVYYIFSCCYIRIRKTSTILLLTSILWT